MADTQSLIIYEATDPDGVISDLHAGKDPSRKRLEALLTVLTQIAAESSNWSSIDKQLARALHLLSFHGSGLIQARAGLWAEDIDELMPNIYICIDEIFGVLED